tara:strand:+ start:45 stop:218 length:174 start_codon:yes stop_codon:yes gene_type:complete
MHYFALWVGGFLMGAGAIGGILEDYAIDRIQKEAIEAGVGRYNHNTSEFEFIKNTKE